MEVFPAAGVFLLIWLVLVYRNADNGVPMVIAVLPFGMFAAVVAAGLSVILANLLAILTIGVLMLRWLSGRPGLASVQLPVSAIYILVFALYSLFSAIVLVRVFQDQFLVFPMNVTAKATRVSLIFPSTMWSLRPTNSNLAQSVYILLSCGFFITAVLVMRRRGASFGDKGMAWAAGLNAILGLLDFLQLDTLLSPIRTADFTLANEHQMAGMARIIGGHAEASVFGAASAAFFGYFFMSYLIGRHRRDGVLALANLACALMALSSTAILALAAAVFLILLHSRTYLRHGISRLFGHVFIIALACIGIVVCLMVILTPTVDLVSKILNNLILSKGNSLSGLERGAWAAAGFDAFIQTWGLGAGAGSLRSNGLAPVLLGSVGLPGTLAFLGFLAHAIIKPITPGALQTMRLFYASRVCALTLLASMLVSATVPDPTLFLMSVAAIAVVTREKAADFNYFRSSVAKPVLSDDSI